MVAVSFIGVDGADTKNPYEATWLKITKTDSGYVVYNYPSLWDDGKTKTPYIIRVQGDSMTWITYIEKPAVDNFENIVKLSDNSYEFKFKIGNNYRFDYIDKTNHIAKWSRYYSYGKLQAEYMCVDSLYNTFPVIEFKWED